MTSHSNEQTRPPIRVLMVATHPVQYLAPLYRRYASDERIQLSVAFCSLQGAEAGIDPGFGIEIAWDVPLLSGYEWVAPRNRSPVPRLDRFLGLFNPSLWPMIRKGGYDVVICSGYAHLSCWVAALAARRSRSRLVWDTDAQSLQPLGGSRWKLRMKRLVVPRIYRFADGVFVKSTRGLQFIGSLLADPSRAFLTPHAVDNSFFTEGAQASDRDEARRNLGVPPDAFVALFVGKFVPWKRPLDLIEAIAGTEGAWAAFVGEGELRRAIEERARALGVVDRVRFSGFVNQKELPAVYAAADVLVLPSSFEPFGLVVNESLACGTPAIVSDACGAGYDLIEGTGAGYTFRTGDVEELARHLESCLDEARRERMSAAARRRIAEWGPEQNANALVEACLRLASRPP